jgi:signal transduction histidine kinase
MWTGRRKATRGFLVASIAALAIPALAVGWLGWLLLQQDRELEQSRVAERLGGAADLAVSSVDQAISVVDGRVATLANAGPSVRIEAAAGSVASADGVFVVMSACGIWTSAPLPYYPQEPDFDDPAASHFAEADRLEFVRGDLAAALASFRRLTGWPDPIVRAGALARVGRVARKLHQPTVALDAYRALAALGSTEALGRPADLVAALERCAVLHDTGQHDRLVVEAGELDRRLLAGHWRLAYAQFAFYRRLVGEWIGADPPVVAGEMSRVPETLAAGVNTAAELDRQPVEPGAADHGRRVFDDDGRRGVIVWRRGPAGLAAFVATSGYASRTWFHDLRAIEDSQRVRLSLSDSAGRPWFGGEVGGDPVRRLPADTGLPFTLQVASRDPSHDAAPLSARRPLLLAVIMALGLIVLAGGYLSARGIGRELAAARLQSDFVAAVSHEFRTPVASVRQLSELLDEGRVPDDSRRTEYYALLKRESVRLQRLVENLLDFGRMESSATEYRMDAVDLTTLLRDLADGFADEVRLAGRRVDVEIAGPLPVVRADREALGRAVWNLLDNAAKYSPSDSPITLEAEALPGSIDIRVRDQGPGIPAAEQDRIFEKLVRGSHARTSGSKGTGLGLAMVKHIVHAHGGSTSVDSQPGAGTTFTIHLPPESAT